MATLTAEIITSGTEILLGDIVDTNAAWIAQQLRECGVNLYYKTTVGDNEPRLRGVIELCMARSDLILITGGLGPTVDDITRDAIANATRCPLLLHDGALATLEGRFARFGVTMTDNNRRQALIPQGAILVENPAGTAPGFIVEGDRSTVIALPGVPRDEGDDGSYGAAVFAGPSGQRGRDPAPDPAHLWDRRKLDRCPAG